jgi:hypothetical protein
MFRQLFTTIVVTKITGNDLHCIKEYKFREGYDTGTYFYNTGAVLEPPLPLVNKKKIR